MTEPQLHGGREVGALFDVWVVHTGAGERDNGRPDPSLVFSKEGAARHAAKGRGWYGGTAAVSSFKAVRATDDRCYFVGGEIGDIDKINADYEEKTRLAAISKLSAEERRILGIVEVPEQISVDNG